MIDRILPRAVVRAVVPPIKCQGIKTKLVPFIFSNLRWDGRGRWVEPFLGSGVVAFSLVPDRALLCDSNPHLIAFYSAICGGTLTPAAVENSLVREGKKLVERGEEHYYDVRTRFNKSHAPLDFLFLNRCCFNGVMRFNGKGGFNVPFCRKPERLRQALVTKIVNQVRAIALLARGRRWEFRCTDWRECVAGVGKDDFVYLDPPYIGRHADYYSTWMDEQAMDLAAWARTAPCGVAMSMWRRNRFRVNEHIDTHWSDWEERTVSHFYHVGSTESLRHEMLECLMVKPGYAAKPEGIEAETVRSKVKMRQSTLFASPAAE